MSLNPKEVLTRSLSGIVFLTLFIGSILYGQYTFVLIFAILSFFGLREFLTLIKNSGIEVTTNFTALTGLFIFLLFGLEKLSLLSSNFFPLGIALAFIPFFAELFKHKEKPFQTLAYLALAYMYVLLPMLFFMFLAFFKYDEYNYQIVLGYLIIIWAHDSGAYGFGVTFGKRRMLEHISPKKSWEGEAGGILFGTIAAYIWSQSFTEPILSSPKWLAVSIIIMITGTLGDFSESMLKRSLGVKDSGNIMPGHGGILDRFDSVLLSAPFVWAFLAAFG
jgi:phosphatidate cytidylyltransferase